MNVVTGLLFSGVGIIFPPRSKSGQRRWRLAAAAPTAAATVAVPTDVPADAAVQAAVPAADAAAVPGATVGNEGVEDRCGELPSDLLTPPFSPMPA